MHRAHNELKALLYGLTAVAMWSTVATAFKIALGVLDVYQLLFISHLSASIILTVIMLTYHRDKPVTHWLQQWKKGLCLGLLNPTLYYLILFAAYDLLPAQIAQPINYTWALVLSFMAAWRYGHRLTKHDWIASCLGYLGVLVLVVPGSHSTGAISLIGVGLAIISTLIWASYWLIQQGDDRPIEYSLWQAFCFSFPVTAFAMLLFSEFPDFSVKAWASGIYIGAFEMGLAFMAWLSALRSTQHTSRISNLIFLSPIISLALIHWVLKESIQFYTVLGLGCILFGLWVQQRPKPANT